MLPRCSVHDISAERGLDAVSWCVYEYEQCKSAHVAVVSVMAVNYCLTIHWWETSLFTWNFKSYWPRWSEIADFRSVFASSASTATPSVKSAIITNRKSTTRFPMSPIWTSYVVRNPLPKGAQKRKVSKIWTISCHIAETVWDRMSVTVNH